MAEQSETPITDLLNTLTTSIESAIQSVPDESALQPPPEELSLLTTKNELFLSYVQNLVFLIIIKLRHCSSQWNDASEDFDAAQLNQEIVEKLVELRLYLEKGIKPLESRLKYQIDKVIRAAEDSSRSAQSNTVSKPRTMTTKDDIYNSDNSNGSSASDANSDSEAEALAAQPNTTALVRPTQANAHNQKNDNIYRPPKITPTALPTTTSKETKRERPNKSAALDEFIADEFSTAPLAEPSIGSTIRAGGRHTLSQREREEAAERRRYEEENFTRLPTKKDKKAKKGQNSFGGEEWRNLGAGLERIGKVMRRGGEAGVLARSRKRDVVDGPRDSGEGVGFVAKRQRR